MSGIELDYRQKEVDRLCNHIALSIKPLTFINKIKNLFCQSKQSRGIYMHGGVGRGKTMLMKKFYEDVSVSKEIIHFQKFMQDLHVKLHKLQANSARRLVQNLAKNIASRAQVLCIDEFEIKDITDAMIIMRLFQYLAQHNVFIFVTTNTKPDNLYLDGMQRESFLPFIAMIKRNFKVLYLDTNKDYRYEVSAHIKERILYPESSNTNAKIEEIKAGFAREEDISARDISIFGRVISFKHTYHNILFTNFDELFSRDLSYNDYVAICGHFKIIILESVRPIAEDEDNIIIRFINFIDNVYFYKTLLFAEFKLAPEQIYIKGKLQEEFARTISRLNEMNSNEYLNKKVSK